MKKLTFALLVAIAPLAVACTSSSSSTPTTSGPKTTCDAAHVADCASSQRACETDAALGATCVECKGGSSLVDGACAAIDGTPVVHDFPTQTIAANAESSGLCRSWTMNNAEEIWVTAVEYLQGEDSHHANYVFVPEADYAGPDGIWKCGDRGYDLYGASAKGGVLYTQSTQAVHEVQRFPKGAAIRIPPHARIISDIHLLNTSSQDTTGHATLTLYEVAAKDVTAKLRAFHVEYDDLWIAPHASARFTADCSVAATVSAATKTPWAPKVYYLLPHTHSKATGFFARVRGGKSDGEVLLDLPSFNGEAHGKAFSPPVDMTGADGFTFGCQYANPTDQGAGWGIGANEMCELFGFAEDTVLFQSRVNKGHATGTDGVVSTFEGPCDTVVLDP